MVAPSALGVELQPDQEYALEKALELQPKDRIQTIAGLEELLFIKKTDSQKESCAKSGASLDNQKTNTSARAEKNKVRSEKTVRREKENLISQEKQKLILLKTVKGVVAVSAAAAVLYAGSWGIKCVQYASAEKAMQNGDFEKAYSIFASLKEFRDSAEQVVYCRKEADYAAAKSLFEAERYHEAAEAFNALGGYADSVSGQYCLVDLNSTYGTYVNNQKIAPNVPVSDRSLLDLHLLGKHGKFSGEGWIRINGTDYYYKYGKPCVNQWIAEEDCLYYLGSRGCITQVASQSMLSDVMNAYFASYQAAFNKKDASLLIYATDKNREEEQKRFQTEDNKYLTISDLTCEATLHKGKDSNGTVMVDVHLEYTQTGEWESAEATSGKKDYRITLTWIDGMWHVDHIGNR